MYDAIVKRIATNNFERVNDNDYPFACIQRLIDEVDRCTRGETIWVRQRHSSDNGHGGPRGGSARRGRATPNAAGPLPPGYTTTLTAAATPHSAGN